MSSSKSRRFSVRPAALDNASAIVDPLRERGTPTQLIEVEAIRLDFDPDNLRDLALTPADLGGVREDDPQAEVKSAELEEIRELATSIRAQGLINPVEVYRRGEHYVLASGQRRYFAHLLLGARLINASVLMQKPKSLRARQYVENEQRVRMTLSQRVRGVAAVLAEAGMEQAEQREQAEHLMAQLGMQHATAYRYLSVATAPEPLRAAVFDGRITSIADAYRLSTVPAPLMIAAVEAYLGGMPLEEAIESAAPPATPVHEAPAAKGKGRPMTAISLGRVTQPNVVRNIMRAVLGDDTPEIDWDDYRAASKAWQAFVKKLEEQYG